MRRIRAPWQRTAPVPAEDLDLATLVRRRLAGDRSDSATLALVIEGGGMRGALSAAMAGVLEAEGITPCLDLVVGTSAGAVNAAAVAAGAAQDMAASYADVFCAREYADPRRLLRGRPAVDTGRIVGTTDELLDLATRALSAEQVRLAAVATDVATADAVALEEREPASLLTALQASGTLPLVGGPPVELHGRRWLDGGIAAAVPLAAARDLGATHALVLTTRPRGTAPSWGWSDVLVERYLRRLNPDLATAYRDRPQRYAAERAEMGTGRHLGVATTVLCPGAHDPLPSRMERDADLLRVAVAAAAETARRTLDTELGLGRRSA